MIMDGSLGLLEDISLAELVGVKLKKVVGRT